MYLALLCGIPVWIMTLLMSIPSKRKVENMTKLDKDLDEMIQRGEDNEELMKWKANLQVSNETLDKKLDSIEIKLNIIIDKMA
jgi:hypothetical protein